MSKFVSRNALSGSFLLDFEKAIIIFKINSLEFVKLQHFPKKQKCLNFGPKMPYFHIFGLEF